ncbi:MAG: hypothetical protein J7L34_01020 [Thermotogaceae bacterium]|nr:hypothetical protein [Thermotogaceae bacterium]
MKIFEIPEIDLKELPVTYFAYIGDAVISLYSKLKYINLKKPSEIEKNIKSMVSKSGQSKNLERIMFYLTDEEKAIVKRAMNSKAATRHGNDRDYRNSTGLEALIGYLFLKKDFERLKKILSEVD